MVEETKGRISPARIGKHGELIIPPGRLKKGNEGFNPELRPTVDEAQHGKGTIITKDNGTVIVRRRKP